MEMRDATGNPLPGHDSMDLNINSVLHDYVTQKKNVADLEAKLTAAREKLDEFYLAACELPVGTKDDFAEIVEVTTTGRSQTNVDIELFKKKYPAKVKDIIKTLKKEAEDAIGEGDIPLGRLKGFLEAKVYKEITTVIPGKTTVTKKVIELDPFGK